MPNCTVPQASFPGALGGATIDGEFRGWRAQFRRWV